MMGKREAVKAILNGGSADRIPMIMNIVSLSADRYGYGMMDIMMSPEKFAECVMGTRKRLGYDGLCSGLLVSVPGMLGGHLPNDEREVSGDGEGVIKCVEDLQKLNPYNADENMNIKGILATMQIMRAAEPDEPQYVIVQNPGWVALSLLGPKRAYKSLVKDPELFKAVLAYVEDALVESVKPIVDAGVDFIWIPMPNFGGSCISRKAYEKCISESNIRFNKRLKDLGATIVIHTCGYYDDRFDLVMKEYGSAWHISDTNTKKVKDEWGDQMPIMGNIPCVSVLLNETEEGVYNYTYEDCLYAAKDGRFILSGDCDVAPPTSDDNIRAAIRARDDAEKVLFGDK